MGHLDAERGRAAYGPAESKDLAGKVEHWKEELVNSQALYIKHVLRTPLGPEGSGIRRNIL